MINPHSILETINMIDNENPDIYAITMGIPLLDYVDFDQKTICDKAYGKTCRYTNNLVKTGEDISEDHGIPTINKRISVTPILMIATTCPSKSPAHFAQALDRATKEVGVNFIGGYSALVHKGFGPGDYALIESVLEVLSTTSFVCSSVSVDTTEAGINMDAVGKMGRAIRECAERTADRDCIGVAKLVVSCNAPEDNPFMTGVSHGPGEPNYVISVGVSGPGVARVALAKAEDYDITGIADPIEKTVFKITCTGQLVAQEVSRRLFVSFGIVDLSLAPTPAVGDFVAYILEEMGLEACGAHGMTAALTLLNDVVKEGGIMASSHVGGLPGALIPVTENAGMIKVVCRGSLTLNKLEIMTVVCSVGLNMIVIPGDTPAEATSGIIVDEAAIGMVNSKTIAVRLIPATGKQIGEELNFGGFLGGGLVMEVNRYFPQHFTQCGGRIPAPFQGLRNRLCLKNIKTL